MNAEVNAVNDEPARVEAIKRAWEPYPHVVAGMHLGRYEQRLVSGEFDAVLDVGTEAHFVPDGTRHAHIHIPYGGEIPEGRLEAAVDWVDRQVRADRRVLVRSEGGKQRPSLVIAVEILRLGGRTFDARTCLHKVDNALLTDFRYRAIVERLDEQMHPAPWATKH